MFAARHSISSLLWSFDAADSSKIVAAFVVDSSFGAECSEIVAFEVSCAGA